VNNQTKKRTRNRNKNKPSIDIHSIRKNIDSFFYLDSYKMEDNPNYNSISYTLMILRKTIIERKDLS